MADDSTIHSAVTPVPDDYPIPSGPDFVLKTVSAAINGSGAAGAYLPALQVLTPSGAVAWTAVPDVAVAAGASVLVSWFPGAGVDDGAKSSAGVTSVGSPVGTLQIGSPDGPAVTIDMPTTGVTPGSYGDAADSAQVTVDAEGRITAATSVPIVGGGTVVGSDGWVNDTAETWTYASFAAGPPAVGTFTVSGDVRAKYTVGTKIKLVQTTTKYFYVTADPTFAAGTTTVTISGGTDYTLANAAISGNFHSYVGNPQGHPVWFNFALGQVGWSGSPSVAAVFSMVGFTMYLVIFVDGTSNATTVSIILPATPDTNNYPDVMHFECINSGANQVSPAVLNMTSAATTQPVWRDGANTAWTNSGQKRIYGSGLVKVA